MLDGSSSSTLPTLDSVHVFGGFDELAKNSGPIGRHNMAGPSRRSSNVVLSTLMMNFRPADRASSNREGRNDLNLKPRRRDRKTRPSAIASLTSP